MDINKRMIIQEKMNSITTYPEQSHKWVLQKVHANLTTMFMGVKKLFLINSRLKRKEELEARL